MPKVRFEKLGEVHEGEVKDDTNLVVRAGIKQFPWPHLRYGCGMGKCSKCASRVIEGAEHLPPPNWKERKILGANLERGYRLVCQLWSVLLLSPRSFFVSTLLLVVVLACFSSRPFRSFLCLLVPLTVSQSIFLNDRQL